MSLYSMYLWLLVLSNPFNTVQGKATVYWPGDGFSGLIRADGRAFTPADRHIAHRSLPLRTPGILCNLRTSLCTATFVGDRGPYGAVRPCTEEGEMLGIRQIVRGSTCLEWQSQVELQEGWEYRITFDLTLAVSKRIEHHPHDELVFFHLKKRNKGFNRWLVDWLFEGLEEHGHSRLAN